MDLDCKTCGKSFKFQSCLSRHGRIHKALREKCDCGLTFSRRDGLKRHRQSCRAFKQAFMPNTLKSSNSPKTEDPQVISDICYSQIRGDFWNADYLGFQVVMMKSNGYINATKLCADGGKHFRYWSETVHSQEMLEYHEKILNQSEAGKMISPSNLTLGGATAGITAVATPNANNTIFPSQSEVSSIPVSIVVAGGDDMLVRGTYVYAKLIPHIASWVSIEFGHRVACIIEDFVVRDYHQKLKMAKDETAELSQLYAQKYEKLKDVDRELSKWG